MIDQVKYTSWRDKNAPPQYWRDISAIAAFIASRLQHTVPRCNRPGNRPVSTIMVHQHKEKFGDVVVYCDIADENLIARQWAEEGNSGDPTPEYIDRCLLRDCCHYRRSYRDMIGLVPHYEAAIVSRANYSELLFASFDQVEEWLSICQVQDSDFCLKCYRAAGFNELREKLLKVYTSKT